MRIQRTEDEWKTIIEQQKKSGQTISAFCRKNGIHPNVFHRKRKQFRGGNQAFIRVHSARIGEYAAGTILIGDIEIKAREDVTDDFLVRMIRCAIEAKNAVVS